MKDAADTADKPKCFIIELEEITKTDNKQPENILENKIYSLPFYQPPRQNRNTYDQNYYYPDQSYARGQTPAYQQRVDGQPVYVMGGYPPPPANVSRGGTPYYVNNPNQPDDSFFRDEGIFTSTFDTVKIRNRFVQRVYTILSLQLFVTFGFIILAVYEKNTRLFFRTHGTIFMIVSMIVFFALYLALVCCVDLRRKFPLNFVMLGLLGSYPYYPPPPPNVSGGGNPYRASYPGQPDETFHYRNSEIFATGFDTVKIRNRFVQRVYTILSVQLFLTFGFIALAVFEPHLREAFVNAVLPIFILGSVLYLGTALVLICVSDLRRRFPINFILLGLLTVAMTLMLTCVSVLATPVLVLYAAGTTALLCFVISLFAIQTKYLMYDTQQIVGGRRIELSPEEYILGALSLYVDMARLFLFILRLYMLCHHDD
ncbi:lifeguard 3-like [Asbolus verrucosus]|uniref:Lifeguard 3-like n=1 Tax=Asbolus verrucosus TaxID=1661398 RepID=A0A482V2C4_ASBVE|nr:lifeguard 3-like [Asbolus verrucosus]